MTPEHFQRLEVLFHEAIELDPILQQGWIDAHCEDAELRDALASLIAHHNQEAIIDTPVELTAATVPNPVGFVLDRKYRIERELGHGGMGNVFLATHLGTERPVALKIIRPEFSANPEYLSRFKREAIAAGKLRHPNIVNVTDFGIAPFGNRSAAYLVMEYLTGESLADRLAAATKLSLAETLDILEQTCAAVGAAHETGIIHRDLKPENIWLQPDGRGGALAKVLDFGLAKLTDGVESPALPLLPRSASENETLPVNQPTTLQPSEHSTLQAPTFYERDTRPASDYPKASFESTLAGAVMGTPLYMSPEQCAGQKVSRASDIYSLGVIAYRMFAGTTPFTGDVFQLMFKHGEEIPEPLGNRQKGIPKGVSETVMRALAKTPAERPVSAAAFAAALRVHADGDAAITLEADRLWRAHRATLMKLAARVALPGILATAFLISTFVQRWSIEFPFIWVLQAALWIVPLLLLRHVADLVTAATARALPDLRANHPVSISNIARDIRRQRFSLLRLGLGGSFSPQRLLAVPAALAETPDNAVSRSKNLLLGLRAFARTQFLKKMSGSIELILAVGIACIPFYRLSLRRAGIDFFASAPAPLRDVYPDLWLSEFFVIAVTLMLLVFIRLQKSAIETAVLFESARAISGESVPKFMPRAAESLHPQLVVPNWARKPVIVAWLLLVSLMWSAVYTVFIPGAGLTVKAERRRIQPIPDSENAWPEYRVAIRKLGSNDVKDLQGQAFGKGYRALVKYAFEKAPLTDEVRAILDDNQDALRHLLEGAKRPKFQFIIEENGAATATPSLLEVRGPINLAAAEVRRLQEAGRNDEAIELMVAAFRMSTDFAEPESSLISLLISMAARNLCSQMVTDWLARGGSDATRQTNLLRRLSDIDLRMPQNMMGCFNFEYRTFHQTLENLVTGPKYSDTFAPPAAIELLQDGLSYAAGVQLATQRGFIRRWDRDRPILEQASNQWDFEKLYQLMTETPVYDPSVGPTQLLVAKLVQNLTPNWFVTMRQFYRQHARMRGTFALLACDIYKKRHGAFPANLETAFEECGVAPQFDPITRKLPGYRLADGVPELWFVGFDRKDDGGKIPYNLEKNKNQIVPGTDFLMRYGQPIEW
jgi:serine/threonine protein kinase